MGQDLLPLWQDPRGLWLCTVRRTSKMKEFGKNVVVLRLFKGGHWYHVFISSSNALWPHQFSLWQYCNITLLELKLPCNPFVFCTFIRLPFVIRFKWIIRFDALSWLAAHCGAFKHHIFFVFSSNLQILIAVKHGLGICNCNSLTFILDKFGGASLLVCHWIFFCLWRKKLDKNGQTGTPWTTGHHEKVA